MAAMTFLYLSSTINLSQGWVMPSTSSPPSPLQKTSLTSLVSLTAKRNRRSGGDGSSDNMNSWYDSVDDDATPDKVFWQEMERQRLKNQLGGTENGNYNLDGGGTILDPVAAIGNIGGGGGGSNGGGSGYSSGSDGSMMMSSSSSPQTMVESSVSQTLAQPYKRKPPTMEEQKAADATLSEYSTFAVKDNWLDEELQSQMFVEPDIEEESLSIDEETQRLEEQLEELPDGYFADKNNMWIDEEEEEIWDVWKRDQDGGDASTRDLDRLGVRQVKGPEPGMFPMKAFSVFLLYRCCFWWRVANMVFWMDLFSDVAPRRKKCSM